MREIWVALPFGIWLFGMTRSLPHKMRRHGSFASLTEFAAGLITASVLMIIAAMPQRARSELAIEAVVVVMVMGILPALVYRRTITEATSRRNVILVHLVVYWLILSVTPAIVFSWNSVWARSTMWALAIVILTLTHIGARRRFWKELAASAAQFRAATVTLVVLALSLGVAYAAHLIEQEAVFYACICVSLAALLSLDIIAPRRDWLCVIGALSAVLLLVGLRLGVNEFYMLGYLVCSAAILLVYWRNTTMPRYSATEASKRNNG